MTTIFDDGHSTTSGGSLLPGAGQLEAFWLAVAIVVGAAVFALVASRQAAYIAAVSLLVFGLWQMYVAVKLQAGLVGGYYWYDFLLRWTDRPVVWLVALASLVSGLFLAERTMVADALGRRSGLTAQVQRLTLTRAAAVDAAAAELRRLERDLHDGAQARLVSLGINLRAAEKLIRTSPDDGGDPGGRVPGNLGAGSRRPTGPGARHLPAGTRRPRPRRRGAERWPWTAPFLSCPR